MCACVCLVDVCMCRFGECVYVVNVWMCVCGCLVDVCTRMISGCMYVCVW